ncbi:MAG TPA: DUF2723 domain-containing protein [candidate division WOR-3 bacterium]|uniref:DUF2723 domain-containing protein n=1 Tax=candidate division WOR-3 bacterium TaxID=2052148 RepID=A0A7V0T4K8_UNCW3|nr:DUF2723 domain-containing protein [candidate division WOR-3 bacterium]
MTDQRLPHDATSGPPGFLTDNRVRHILFGAVFAVVFGVYLYSVAPTSAFWDCGEFIAASYVLGIPHPPGTPLYVAIGRLFTLLPLNPEIAFRVNFICVLFGALACALIYLITVQLITIYRQRDKHPWLKHVAGVFGALMCAFAFSFWDNNVEAEVYGPSATVALAVLYMAMRWRVRTESGTADNRLVLLAIFLLFLSTGIHFTPMIVVFSVLIFCLLVNRQAILQLRLFEFALGLLTLVTVVAMPDGGGEAVVFKLFIAAVMLGAVFFGVRLMERSDTTASLIWGLLLLVGAVGVGFVASGGDMMDNTVLFLATPLVAFLEMWVEAPVLLVLFVILFAGYLYWLHTQGRLNLLYVGLMLGVMMVASSVQFIMLVRSGVGPRINEVDPSNWEAFVSVLRREQYDPMRLLPRKTQFLTENDYRIGTNPTFSLFIGVFEQIKFYLRYFLWQWGGERYFDIFLGVRWPALLGIFPPLLGLWGMWHQFKHEKKSFVLIFLAFLVASLGLIVYLNLKYSPSDPRPHLQFREVRERDYFYAFSFVFYTIFIGVGAYAFLRWLVDASKGRKIIIWLVSGATVAYGFVPMFLNYRDVTRRHNWIPAEYGYNMLVSCPGEKTVIFTNGDNDTFPLWFMQEVPSVVADLDPEFGKNVAVANLSLLNTVWYCQQLKEWGAPISFTVDEIERLPQGFIGDEGRTFLLKDIMMRDIVATAAGVQLTWPDDYASPSAAFKEKVFGRGYEPQRPVYFATTVSTDNLRDFDGYLMLEGLVNRVVPTFGHNQVDAERTHDLLFNVYKMNSMLDPNVEKDDNTRGLLINYAASYLALANEYHRLGQTRKAQEILTRAMDFPLDDQRRVPLFYHLSIFAQLNHDYANAVAYIDSIEALGFTDPELTMRRGMALQGKGETSQAEREYVEAVQAAPNRPEPVQALYRFYLEDLNDTVKARQVLLDWLQRMPSDTVAKKMLESIR